MVGSPISAIIKELNPYKEIKDVYCPFDDNWKSKVDICLSTTNGWQ